MEPQTPLKNSSRASEAALLESHKNMGPLTTPTKGLEAPSSEPWTPTSNLKMLISAASPEIRNREKERAVDSGESENSQVSIEVCVHLMHLPLFVDLLSVLLNVTRVCFPLPCHAGA